MQEQGTSGAAVGMQKRKTALSQCEDCAIVVAADLVSSAKHLGFAVIADWTLAVIAECLLPHPSAVPSTGPGEAAVGVVPELSCGSFALDSSVPAVHMHAAPRRCFPLDQIGLHCSLCARAAAAGKQRDSAAFAVSTTLVV